MTREDRLTAAPEPRANPDLVGQDLAQQVLLQAYRSGRMPHAWLLTGPQGVGKATLAFRFARFLLAQGSEPPGLLGPPEDLSLSPEHGVFRQVASSGHPDLQTIERQRDQRNRLRRDIVIEDLRKAAAFLRLTPALGGWRVVVIDGAEDMNRNAANALLKVLEEPPARALILLTSHFPGRLLPTIRSRCCRLAVPPLPRDTVLQLLHRYVPELSGPEAESLSRLADGSIGRALALANSGGIGLFSDALALIEKLPRLDMAKVHGFAEKIARDQDGEAFRTLAQLLTWWLARLARGHAAKAFPQEIVPGEAALLQRLAATAGLAQWLALWEKVSRLFADAERASLDRKQVIISAFLELEALTSRAKA